MGDAFQVRVTGRGYEVDANGHVAGVVIMEYGQHARWECLRAAGVEHAALLRAGVGPVSLEESISFHHELRPGEDVDVSCTYVWGQGKTFRVKQELPGPTGHSSVITNVGGLLDLTERRLLPDPGTRWRSVATNPELLGL